MFHQRKNLSIRIWKIVLLAVILSTSSFCIVSLIMSQRAVKKTIQQRMIDIANCASGSVNGDGLKRIKKDSIGSAGYYRISNTLAIFLNNIEAKYIYAVRIEDDDTFTISIDPSMETIDEFGIPIEATPALISASKGVSSVDDFPTTDKWGTFYSAYSPVFDADGNVAGIIGVDFEKEWYDDQINEQSTQILISSLIILFFCLVIASIMCFFTIRTITRPINQLTTIASEYKNGDFSHEIEIYDEEKMGILSSTLKSMASSLTEQIKNAEEANRAKSNFLANMSHEIRTPINAVLGMNEMILRESTEPEIRSYSENIKSAGTTLLNIINDILDFSKIEAGKLEITPVDYDLSTLLNDLVNMIHPRLEAKDLALNLDFDPNLPRNLFGDPIRIKQIITNILTNAAKYTEEGSITFKMSFEKPENDPDNIILLVSVKDTGTGIKPEDMKKLFSEFERIDEKRHRNIEGTGLGISITQSLLAMMGSALEVESTYGEGSDFHFALRQKFSGDETLGDFEVLRKPVGDANIVYREKFTAPGASILVVDDNPMNLIVFKNLVKQTLISTDTASSGDESLVMMQNKKYDIIFLDHMMPNKDGIATLHEMKQDTDNPNLNAPVICLTANAISGVRDEYIAEGFDDYLTKPINPETLEEMLIKYLPEELVEIKKDDEKKSVSKNPSVSEKLSGLMDQDLIDVNVGIENSSDENGFLSMLGIFSGYADENAEELNRFFSEEDFENYTIKIHALKSSSKIIGALGLSEDAQNLENAGKAKDYDFIRNGHEAYMEKFLQVVELINRVLNKPNGSSASQPVAEPWLIEEAFDQIKTYAQIGDCESIEIIYKDMTDYSIPEDTEPLWNQVKEAFDSRNFEKIEELLK